MLIKIKKTFCFIAILNLFYVGAGADSINSGKTFLILLTPAMICFLGLAILKTTDVLKKEMKLKSNRKKIARRAATRRRWDYYLSLRRDAA